MGPRTQNIRTLFYTLNLILVLGKSKEFPKVSHLTVFTLHLMLLGRFRAALFPSASFSVFSECRLRLFCSRITPVFQRILLVFQQVVCVFLYNCLFFSYFMLVSILIPSLECFCSLSLSLSPSPSSLSSLFRFSGSG